MPTFSPIPIPIPFMKAFLQHDASGLFYGADDRWVESTHEALAFSTLREAELFCATLHGQKVHTVSRLDPNLIARFSTRAPGTYQVGE